MLVLSIGAASAYGGKFFGTDHESREDMVNAIEAKNFDDWKAAKEDRMSEENFNERVAKHEARAEMRELREDKKLAIEAGDYEAFKVAAKNWPILPNIQNEDDFETLVELHQAKLDGDYETVEELREELGLLGGFGMHKISGQFGR